MPMNSNLLANTTYTKYPRHDNAKGTWKFCRVLPDCQSHYFRLTSWRQARQTNQHHSMHVEALTNHHLPKVLVCRQQQRCLLICQVQDSIIRHPWTQFSHIRNVIPLLPQTFDNWTVNTLLDTPTIR